MPSKAAAESAAMPAGPVDVHGQTVGAAGRCRGSGRRSAGACLPAVRAEVDRHDGLQRLAVRRTRTGPIGLPCTPSKPASCVRVGRRLGPVGRASARSAARRRPPPGARSGTGTDCWICEHLGGLGAAGQPRRGVVLLRAGQLAGQRTGECHHHEPEDQHQILRPAPGEQACRRPRHDFSLRCLISSDAIDRPPRASTTFASTLREPSETGPARHSRARCRSRGRTSAGYRNWLNGPPSAGARAGWRMTYLRCDRHPSGVTT